MKTCKIGGYSKSIVIPKIVCEELEIGDREELEYTVENKKLIISKKSKYNEKIIQI